MHGALEQLQREGLPMEGLGSLSLAGRSTVIFHQKVTPCTEGHCGNQLQAALFAQTVSFFDSGVLSDLFVVQVDDNTFPTPQNLARAFSRL